MKGYIVNSWSPKDCEDFHLRMFFCKTDATYFIKSYTKTRKEEDLTIEEVEVDVVSLCNEIKDILYLKGE